MPPLIACHLFGSTMIQFVEQGTSEGAWQKCMRVYFFSTCIQLCMLFALLMVAMQLDYEHFSCANTHTHLFPSVNKHFSVRRSGFSDTDDETQLHNSKKKHGQSFTFKVDEFTINCELLESSEQLNA